MTIKAIYENGVFRPTEPVDFPERARVRLDAQLDAAEPPADVRTAAEAQPEVFEILSRRYNSGQHDVAERHNEHQP